jgi:hypothetical protein
MDLLCGAMVETLFGSPFTVVIRSLTMSISCLSSAVCETADVSGLTSVGEFCFEKTDFG